ncbi:MBL fold metallo-hydrolase [Pseudonocardia sp. KRD-169]|uniref:MBL fold metallo-hydrolase n=2 Tax=Pseudonocardia abyssalis TaxID=2792008 RepID=A0ABS6UYT3_9PSEU|nr:MBL fold metallo-hydrolase [Pseudonocardia abyssalis]MBW0137419.1 MBL fold metallo-hydrolase [Pseudonocardia abyssalis]
MLPDGSWGWSNAGLIVGEGESLLVDTLFDLDLAAEMLAGFGPITEGRPITTVVNTHSDGDHTFGNQLLAARGAEIVGSVATAELVTQDAVASLQRLKTLDGPAGDFARHIFAPFQFDGIIATAPTRTFVDRMSLHIGGRPVELIQVGPAHTAGDTLVYVPDAQLLYTGDILFNGGTPVVWAGPLNRWVAACDLILDLDVTTIVPGHGAVTDKSAVVAMRDYLVFVESRTTELFEDGLTPEQAVEVIDLGPYAGVPESGRIVQNVLNVYHQLDDALPMPDQAGVFGRIAAREGFLAERSGEKGQPLPQDSTA